MPARIAGIQAHRMRLETSMPTWIPAFQCWNDERQRRFFDNVLRSQRFVALTGSKPSLYNEL